MKKTVLITALALGLLGTSTMLNAQALPSVSAGTSQTITLPTNSVTLTGVATSAGGAISTYAWTKVSGGTAVIASPSAASTLVTDLAQGVYTFRLSATDVANATATADVMVTVQPAPVLTPVVSAGAPQTIIAPTATATLSGNATASSGRMITGYAWTQVSGPAASVIATPTTASTQVSGLTVAGVYTYALAATDSALATASATTTITVRTTPVPPTQSEKSKMQLEINPNGKVALQGTILSNNAGVLTVNIWGILFTINTAGARMNGYATDAKTFAVGDMIRVNGVMNKDTATPTITAKIVRNVTAHNRIEKQKKYEDRVKKQFEKEGKRS